MLLDEQFFFLSLTASVLLSEAVDGWSFSLTLPAATTGSRQVNEGSINADIKQQAVSCLLPGQAIYRKK